MKTETETEKTAADVLAAASTVKIPYQVVRLGKSCAVFAPAIILFARGISPEQAAEHVSDCAKIFFRELCGYQNSRDAFEELREIGWRQSHEGSWLPPETANHDALVEIPRALVSRRSKF